MSSDELGFDKLPLIKENDSFFMQEMALLKWLDSGQSERRFKEVSARRAGNAGRWFLESKEYKQWVDSSRELSVLLCYGQRNFLCEIC
jgi:hypothetical protein